MQNSAGSALAAITSAGVFSGSFSGSGATLTVSDAFRLMMVRIAKEKALPFEPLVPNAKTIAAIKEARTGRLKGYRTTKVLLKSLNADD